MYSIIVYVCMYNYVYYLIKTNKIKKKNNKAPNQYQQ